MFQHSCYYDSLARWVRMVDEIRYIYEDESPEWDAHFIQWEENVMSKGTFDHRCIQALHDMIAAQYRKNLIDETPPAKSMRKKVGWRDFFKNEAFDFLQEKEVVWSFITALSENGSEDGYDAEDALFLKMLEKYGVLLPAVICE